MISVITTTTALTTVYYGNRLCPLTESLYLLGFQTRRLDKHRQDYGTVGVLCYDGAGSTALTYHDHSGSITADLTHRTCESTHTTQNGFLLGLKW